MPAQSHGALACFWSSVGLSTKSSAMQKMTWKAASPVSQHHLAHQLNSQCLDIRVTLCSFLDLAVPKSLAPLEPVSLTCCVSKVARSSARKPAVNPAITHHSVWHPFSSSVAQGQRVPQAEWLMQYPGLGHIRRHVGAAWQDVLLQAVTGAVMSRIGPPLEMCH